MFLLLSVTSAEPKAKVTLRTQTMRGTNKIYATNVTMSYIDVINARLRLYVVSQQVIAHATIVRNALKETYKENE